MCRIGAGCYLLLLAEGVLVVEQLETVENVVHRDQRIGEELGRKAKTGLATFVFD